MNTPAGSETTATSESSTRNFLSFTGVLRGGDDAVRHDDAAATIRCEMFGDVIGEEHFRLFRRDAKLCVRADTAFRRHERRIGENEVGLLVPTRFIRKSVVDVNRGIGETVKEQITLLSFTIRSVTS